MLLSSLCARCAPYTCLVTYHSCRVVALVQQEISFLLRSRYCFISIWTTLRPYLWLCATLYNATRACPPRGRFDNKLLCVWVSCTRWCVFLILFAQLTNWTWIAVWTILCLRCLHCLFVFTLFSFVNANHGEHFRICGPLLCFGLEEGGWVIYPFLVLVALNGCFAIGLFGYCFYIGTYHNPCRDFAAAHPGSCARTSGPSCHFSQDCLRS